jgi:hypothetical protein
LYTATAFREGIIISLKDYVIPFIFLTLQRKEHLIFQKRKDKKFKPINQEILELFSLEYPIQVLASNRFKPISFKT